MYTQWLKITHNALWESRAELIPTSRQKMAHAAVHFNTARPRNTTQVQIHCKWIITFLNYGLYIFSVTVKDKSFNLTTGAARFKWLLNSKQTMQKRQSFWCTFHIYFTQCPNSLTWLHRSDTEECTLFASRG